MNNKHIFMQRKPKYTCCVNIFLYVDYCDSTHRICIMSLTEFHFNYNFLSKILKFRIYLKAKINILIAT